MSETMQAFTEDWGFIIFFLVGTLLLVMLLGEKVAVWYLVLVLLGMVYANVEKFSEFTRRFAKA